MFPNERYDVILKLISEKNSVTVSELVKRLDVSVETVRRDLFSLENGGKLKRVHGGAVAMASTTEYPLYLNRLAHNKEKKDSLSEKAMSLITENDLIAVDSGSTSISFAYALLKSFKKLTVVTYSKDVINILSENDDFSIISTGGRYLPAEKAFYGAVANLSLENLHFDKAFIFPSAVSLEHGVQDFSYEIIDMQKQLMKKSNKVYILADSTKFEKTANISLTRDLSLYTFVSDDELSDPIKDIYTKNKIKVL